MPRRKKGGKKKRGKQKPGSGHPKKQVANCKKASGGCGKKKAHETSEDSLRRVSNEMSESCDGEAVLRMAKMMAMIPTQRKYVRDVCQVHVEYPRNYKWPPSYLREAECKRFLFDTYAHGAAIGMHHLKLVDTHFAAAGVDHSDLFKRLGGVFSKRRFQWLNSLTSPECIGKVDTEFKPKPYALDVFRSFRNATEVSLMIALGKTHVAIGFCDFDELLNANIQQIPTRSPLRYIGVDACVHSVAKFKVVWEMIRNPDCGLESVCEVWYSSVWTRGTLSDFKRACAKALEIVSAEHCSDDSVSKPTKAKKPTTADVRYERNAEVATYIKAWMQSEGVSLKRARQQWFDEKKERGNSAQLNFKRKVDVLEACHYWLTGELLMRQKPAVDDSSNVGCDDSKSTLPEETSANCGSVTMFENAAECPPHTKEDDVYNVIPLKELTATWKARGSLLSAFKARLLQRLTEVRKLALAKRLTVEVFCALIHESKDKVAVEWLRSLKPYSVSWSNCVDYFETPAVFHSIAHAIGSEDCVHFAYSMNWPLATLGAFVIDYPNTEWRAEIIDNSLKAIDTFNATLALDSFLKSPPIDNAINYGSVLCMNLSCKSWAKWFFSRTASGLTEDICYVETEVFMPVYNPLIRANTCLRLVWSYAPVRFTLKR